MDGSHSYTKFPVVLRCEGIHPSDLARLNMHGLRRGGDLGQCDPVKMERQKKAKPLIGGDDWLAKTLSKIEQARVCNFADELEALKKRNRKKDIEQRLVEGPKDPWRATRHGPMRELILTANKDFFGADPAALFGEDDIHNERIKAFQGLALEWLQHQFGDDVVYARADHDEAAFHIHAVILPMVEVKMMRTDKLKDGTRSEPYHIATRTMLQPSKFAVIRNYEKAQDSVGEWFSEIGLTRGEERKAAFREAMKNGKEPPEKRQHVRTAIWRKQEEVRLANERAELDREKRAFARQKDDEGNAFARWKEEAEYAVARKNEEAEAVIDFANQVVSGQIAADSDLFAENVEALPPNAKSKSAGARGFERARAAFQAAFARMNERADAKAIIAAEARVARDVAEIKAADEVLVGIARLLPKGLLLKVAEARKSLTTKIMRLDRRETTALDPQKPSDLLDGEQVE